MAVTARKYNPGFLTDDELVASFSVRTHEFASILEMLLECTGRSNTHQIVIGPRGSGKTSLLLRVAAELRRAPELQSDFFPIVFAEESYEVATAGEFWLECLAHLAAQAPRGDDDPDLHRTFEELRTIRDDRTLADRCLGALQDFSDREGKRLVLLVENLNMMFRDMSDPDAGWRLRKVLQTEHRIVLLASATSRFDEIDDPEHALYEQFRVLSLCPLDTSECATLWETVAGQCPRPGTIRSLEILTGGSPRLLTIVARFGAELSFRKLMASLLDLIDDHTEYFKSHLEALPAQERRVYLALAALWKPATTREIADHTRLDTSKCSAQLTRLIERGAVQTAGGSTRRKQYYLTERLYNIYYLLRRSRRSDRLVEALIHFMESYYSPSELKDISARIIRDEESFTNEMQSLSQAAISQLIELPALADHREELLAISVIRKAVILLRSNRIEEALTQLDELVRRFGDSQAPEIVRAIASALVAKGAIMDELGRMLDALASYDEAVRRFWNSDVPEVAECLATAFVNKGSTLSKLNRHDEALAACDEAVHRFSEVEDLGLPGLIGNALVIKGFVLNKLKRPQEALAVCDEVVAQFGQSETPVFFESVAKALFHKGVIYGDLNQPDDAIAAYDEVVHRFGRSEYPSVRQLTAMALAHKGFILGRLDRPEEALLTLDDAIRRFKENEQPDSPFWIEFALLETAEIELESENYGVAIETANRALEQNHTEVSDMRWRGHLIRAKAILRRGDRSGCEGDVEAMLALLPKIGSLPKEDLDALMFFGAALGAERMRELIKAAPAADFLLPLTTALEMELGLEPRVAHEVKEVAEDIRRDFTKMRDAATGGSGEANLVSDG